MANNSWTYVFAGLAIGGFAWAVSERNKKGKINSQLNKERAQNEKLKKDYLTLLQEYLDKQKELPNEIKDKLIHLREKYSSINPKVEDELKTVQELIAADKSEIAIEKLTKIIENLLAFKLIEEGHYPDKKKCPTLFKMLEKAKELNIIGKSEYLFSLFLKENRNQEAHELAVKHEENWKLVSFLGGIELIYSLESK